MTGPVCPECGSPDWTLIEEDGEETEMADCNSCGNEFWFADATTRDEWLAAADGEDSGNG